MITTPLSREAAEQLFTEEAIVMSGTGAEGIAQYRIVELFGEPAAAFMERNIKAEGYLIGGKDYNATGAASIDRPMIYYLYKAGFYKVVAEHNYLLSLQAHKASEGGSIVDALWRKREQDLAEREAEEEAKRAERAAKRKAAREAKEREGK